MKYLILSLLTIAVFVGCAKYESRDSLRVSGCKDAVMENLNRRFGPPPAEMKDRILSDVEKECKDLLGVK